MRLFVALDLPPAFRAVLAEWHQQTLRGRSELRPVAADALHVTLCFLGWQPEKEVERIAGLTAAACAGLPAPRLRARALEAVPRRRPRLFAVDLEDRDGGATAIQATIAGALAGARVFEPERRPFWPHLTLARVKRGARAEPLDAAPPPGDEFEASVVTLYRSTLRPQGAAYDPLAGVRLGD